MVKGANQLLAVLTIGNARKWSKRSTVEAKVASNDRIGHQGTVQNQASLFIVLVHATLRVVCTRLLNHHSRSTPVHELAI